MGDDSLRLADADRTARQAWQQVWHRRSLLVAIAALLGISLVALAPAHPAFAATITVNSTGDDEDPDDTDGICDVNPPSTPGSEVCTFRAAIQTAQIGGPNEIQFAIPPGPRPDGVRVIEVGGCGCDLPPITGIDRLTINGRSQGTTPNGAPLILIVPAAGGPHESGLYVAGGTATIVGVAIGGFDSGIVVLASDGTIIKGSYIGLDPDGSTTIGNGIGVDVMDSANTEIGGSTASERNVISGNNDDGIRVAMSGWCGCGSIPTTIHGNVIGLNPAGQVAKKNFGNGIHVYNAPDVLIGGVNADHANVISGNDQSGIVIEGEDALNTIIYANRIGTNAAGTAPIGNREHGIALVPETVVDPGPLSVMIGLGSAGAGPGNLIAANGEAGIYILNSEVVTIAGNVIGLLADGSTPAPNDRGIHVYSSFDLDIGGATAADRNVISGNVRDGILLEAACGCGATDVRGNYIGVNSAGTTAVPNGWNGVRILQELPVFDASGIIVGGRLPGEGNLISGNGRDGVSIIGFDAVMVGVFGNRIGTNASGTAAIGNGRDGVSVLPVDPTLPFSPMDLTTVGPSETGVGSNDPGAGNVISGNGRHGVYLLRAIPGLENPSLVARNLIGVNAANTGPIPNGGDGVLIEESFFAVASENTIANNGKSGVVITPLLGLFSTMVTGNAIVGNQGVGIDLSPTVTSDGVGNGVTANTPDDINNFPVLTTATTSAAGTTIAGTLDGPAGTPSRIELFSSPSCDPSGFGEGRTFLGGVDVQTDAAGIAAFAVTTPALQAGQVVTATSTSLTGQTSEFSRCLAVMTAAVVVTPTVGLTTTEAGGTATFTVKLSTLPVADVTIGLSSSKTSEATVSPASLTFTSANGTAEQTVTVTGVLDEVADGNQLFTIVTAPAVSLDPAYNGIDGPDVIGQNLDSPTLPALSILSSSAIEATGTAVPITFIVALQPSSTQPVTVNWQVIDSSAKAATDLLPGEGSGSLQFAPGETWKTITLHVVGDTEDEGTETFTIRLSGARNAALGADTATGTIFDNDRVTTTCSPRPKVEMSTTRSGADRITVSVKAGVGVIQKIAFGSETHPMQNAVVETSAPDGLIERFGTFTPSAPGTVQSFVVRRLASNQSVLVPLVIEDGCGQWTTFVGGGTAAF